MGGHGRTGTTLVVLSRMLQAYYGLQDQMTQIETLIALRNQRSWLVETWKQYEFALDLLSSTWAQEQIIELQ